MSTQSDAVRDYFHENGISNRDVAERLGVHEGSVSNILSGRYGISKKIAARLTDLYGFTSAEETREKALPIFLAAGIEVIELASDRELPKTDPA